MSNITGIGGGATTFNKREIYIGPASKTFTAVSSGLVEVNCWGGGGNGGSASGSGGGGGGGYVRYIYNLAAGDQLSITVGGQGGTSSVSCPSQSPTSPISATGGSTGGIPGPEPYPDPPAAPGGTGGSGTGTVPSPTSGFLWTADGGAGSIGKSWTGSTTWYGGGGGCAGSEYGDGVDNTNPPPSGPGGGPNQYGEVVIGGAGVGGNGNVFGLPGQPQVFEEENPFSPTDIPTPSRELDYTYIGKGGPGSKTLGETPWAELYYNPSSRILSGISWSPWFYSHEQKGGSGGSGIRQTRHESAPAPNGPHSHRPAMVSGSMGGFMAGGVGGFRKDPSSRYYNKPFNRGYPGGIAGGGGGLGQATSSFPAPTSFGSGGAGLVIIYYSI